jgi:hypothetical protein
VTPVGLGFGAVLGRDVMLFYSTVQQSRLSFASEQGHCMHSRLAFTHACCETWG